MIQELLGDAGLLLGDRKITFNNGGVVFEGSPSSSPSPSLSPSPISPSATTITTTTANTGSASATSSSENLRCPRCDSSNTKFCYYNNYNLTQPRHFCKTCRRYWTKGGALRNIPIGGGCRKNKSSTVSNSTAGRTTSAAKVKTTCPSEIIKSLGSGFSTHDQMQMATNTVLWGSPQNSQLLALLRATQNPNPNLLSNAIGIKDEAPMIASHVNTETTVATGALNATALGLDPPGQMALGLFGSLSWRNNQHHQLHERHQPQQNSVLLGETQNSGIQELYQRIRSSSNNHYSSNDHHSSQGFALTPNAPSSALEPVSGTGGEFGYWNPPFYWSDLPTSNTSFP